MSRLIEILNQLLSDCELYLEALNVSDREISAGIELTDTHQTATIVVADSVTITDGLNDPAFKITMTEELLEKAMKGQVDLFALGGRSRMDEARPVDFEFYDKTRMKESMELIYRLGIFFFVPGRVKSRQMKLELTGKAHGANPLPLVYWKDLRTAWYHVSKGSVLNEDGEKDPYPQAFIVLKGNGRLVLEDLEVSIGPQNTYYIPQGSMHQVHAEEDVELIWMAWDAPMFK